MDAVADFLRRLPDEISRVGGSLVRRAGLLALAVLLNIGFYLPSLPEGTPGAGVPGLDKAVHLLLFALTVFAAGRLLAPRKRFPMGWVVIIALVHALLIELVQLVALPQRSGDGLDILFDVIGIALGIGLWTGERLRRSSFVPELETAAEPEPAADGHR
ncbi:MAG: VanZ family protein [Brachybacterium sp.]